MALLFYKWSKTAASNGTADAQAQWPEGMAPSSVNDSARAMMASAAGWRDDISGTITTGGTSTALTVTSNQVFDSLANMNGAMLAFVPHATNGATVTLNVDGLGAKPLRSAPSVELQAGTIIQGTPYVATYNNSDAVWYLQNFYGNPYNVPLGAGMDYWLPTAPNSSFVFPIGQAISRTTYATLFAAMGTTYGTGDGTTTFNLPDKRGRVSAALDASAGRLTDAVSGFGDGLGEAGGSQSKTLVTANLPAYTPSGTISNGAISISHNAAAFPNTTTGGGGFQAGGGSASISASQSASTFTGNAQGGTSSAFGIVQPTIVCNYILRII
ncbi:tail fiber protein [Bradyrhizobium icense]|uniref:Phage tail protein n=1 Tax=Bradyrhizobium icense TaxID=1274631 RepID=A0A1B1UHL8_9BRAD|nr:tail fiber protein [Bradyrhizobium icense]ANW02251.1 phage tail protein [Bradyrhizobium icense]